VAETASVCDRCLAFIKDGGTGAAIYFADLVKSAETHAIPQGRNRSAQDGDLSGVKTLQRNQASTQETRRITLTRAFQVVEPVSHRLQRHTYLLSG
jgi:hypothetical protein